MFPDIAKCPLRGKTLLVEILVQSDEQWEGETKTQLSPANMSCQLWIKDSLIPSLVFPMYTARKLD